MSERGRQLRQQRIRLRLQLPLRGGGRWCVTTAHHHCRDGTATCSAAAEQATRQDHHLQATVAAHGALDLLAAGVVRPALRGTAAAAAQAVAL